MNRYQVPEHLFLQRDERIAREDEAFVFLLQIVGLFDEQRLGTRQRHQIISPGHLQPAEVLTTGRRRPEPIHPRRRTEDSDHRGLVARVRRNPG
jgi:hypothetical protein